MPLPRPALFALALGLPLPALAEPAFAPGTYGDPVTVTGLMQGCLFGEDGQSCVLHAPGWRLVVDAAGPTPPAIVQALRLLPVNAPVEISGDIIDLGDVTATVALSEIAAGRDDHARLRALLQGAWVTGDGARVVQIDGSEWSESVDGTLQSEHMMQLAADCGDGRPQAAPVITLVMMGGDPGAVTCYRPAEAGLDRLLLDDLGAGGTLTLMRTP